MVIKARMQRYSGRLKGNVLVMAIFIAVFLFFLSVAIVAQNRQNILLILSEDHRLRATNGANAALDLGLHVMRHNPDWRRLLPGHNGELESGGSWEIASIKYSHTAPHLLEIEGKGSSALFASTKKRLVEEIAFDTAIAEGGSSTRPTHLFAYAIQDDTPKLAVLTPDMRWQILGTPPDPSLPWLVAGEGPLFTHAVQREHQFTIQDVSKDGVLGEQILTSSTRPIVFLQVTPEAMRWSDSKYPCNAFHSTADDKKSDDERVSPGSGSETLTKYTDAQVRNLLYNGPTLEWYTSEGSALAAHGKQIYCHGLHHYYRGTQAQISSKGYTVLKQSKTYSAPALLKYDASSDSWSVIMDMMKVKDRDSEPDIVASNVGNTANIDSLTYLDGTLYSISSSNKSRVLRAGNTAWSGDSTIPGESLGIYGYGHSLLHHKKGKIGKASEQIEFSSTPLLQELYIEHPARSVKVNGADLEVWPKFALYPTLTIAKADKYTPYNYKGNNSLAVCGRDMYTFVSMCGVLDEPNSGLKDVYPSLYNNLRHRYSELGSVTVEGIAHYDGERWQLWPNGLNDLAATWTSTSGNARLRWIYDRRTGQAAKLQLRNIAAPHYDTVSSTQTHINRYTTLLDRGN